MKKQNINLKEELHKILHNNSKHLPKIICWTLGIIITAVIFKTPVTPTSIFDVH